MKRVGIALVLSAALAGVSSVGAKAIETASAANLKRTWTEWTGREWLDPRAGEGREFLRRSVQVKNIWIPYGE